MTAGAATVLLADVGGTNVRFAVAEDGRLGPVTRLAAAEYASLQVAIEAYLASARPAVWPRRAALALAGPVEGDTATLTNLGWRVRGAEIGAALGFERVDLANDFAAVARALPVLEPGDRVGIGGGEAMGGAPRAVVGPGTGLGVAAYVPAPGGGVAVAGEGGHVTMPAASSDEQRLIDRLREEFGHVSAERLLSGEGLVRIYRDVVESRGLPPESTGAAEITAAARREAGPCRIAVDRFCAMLGTVAGDLALTFGARGGVYLAGGIVPRIVDLVPATPFRERFEDKGRFRGYLERIPTWVVTHPDPALLGLVALIAARDPR